MGDPFVGFRSHLVSVAPMTESASGSTDPQNLACPVVGGCVELVTAESGTAGAQ